MVQRLAIDSTVHRSFVVKIHYREEISFAGTPATTEIGSTERVRARLRPRHSPCPARRRLARPKLALTEHSSPTSILLPKARRIILQSMGCVPIMILPPDCSKTAPGLQSRCVPRRRSMLRLNRERMSATPYALGKIKNLGRVCDH